MDLRWDCIQSRISVAPVVPTQCLATVSSFHSVMFGALIQNWGRPEVTIDQGWMQPKLNDKCLLFQTKLFLYNTEKNAVKHNAPMHRQASRGKITKKTNKNTHKHWSTQNHTQTFEWLQRDCALLDLITFLLFSLLFPCVRKLALSWCRHLLNLLHYAAYLPTESVCYPMVGWRGFDLTRTTESQCPTAGLNLQREMIFS